MKLALALVFAVAFVLAAAPAAFAWDANVDAAVKAEMLAEGTDLAGIYKLNIVGVPVTDLSGLEGATGLKYLNIIHSPTAFDLTPISGLQKLITLGINGSQVSNLAPIHDLQLWSLFAANNQIKDISALTNMSTLGDVDLDGNELTDISALANKSNMIQLNVSYNYLDVAPGSPARNIIDSFGPGVVTWAPQNGLTVPPGTNVVVALPLGGTVTFPFVPVGGTLTVSQAPPPNPYANYLLVGTASYNISADFAFVGPAVVTLPYDPMAVAGDSSLLKMMHYDWATSTWKNITTTHSHVTQTVTGLTQSFSPFGIYELEPGTPMGEVSGRVTAGDTGVPIEGATVTVEGLSPVTTSAEGTYAVAGIEPMNYDITFAKAGYETRVYRTPIYAGEVTTIDATLPVLAGGAPAIAVDKVTVDGGMSGDGLRILSGEPIRWRYTVTNAGDVALSGISVTDDRGVYPAYVSGDANADGMLDLTEAWVFEASGTSVVGNYANTATVIGMAPLGGVVTDSDSSSYIGTDPRIAIDKVTFDDGVSGDGLRILSGEPIGWRYTVTNVGAGRLGNVTVTDSVAGVTPVYVSGDTNGNGYLEPTETWVYEAAGSAILGNYSNTGTASATGSDAAGHFRTTTASNTSNYRGVDPKIVIDKVTVDGATSGDGLSIHSGEPITWRYTVTKSGVGSLGSIVVTDSDPSVTPMPVLGPDGIHNIGDTDTSGYIEFSEAWVFEASGIALNGDYANTGTAVGTTFDGAGHYRETTASDTSSYFGSRSEDRHRQRHLRRWREWRRRSGSWPASRSGGATRSPTPAPWRCPESSWPTTRSVTPTYVSGDTNGDGMLDITEAWVFEASGASVVGNYFNVGTASGTHVDSAGDARTVTDSDTSNYIGTDPQYRRGQSDDRWLDPR